MTVLARLQQWRRTGAPTAQHDALNARSRQERWSVLLGSRPGRSAGWRL
jgi:hypothetical protein